MTNLFKELSIFNRITFVESSHTYLIDEAPTNSPSVTQLLKRFKRKFDLENMSSRVAKKRGVTQEQIKAEWEMNNLYSTTIGSMLHKYIENFYCNKKINYEGTFQQLGYDEKRKLETNFPKLVKYFHNFYNDNKHLHCVKNEIVLGDITDTKVCGTSDMLCYNEMTDSLEILDFKTNKKMDRNSKHGKLFYPFEHLDECEINEYTIQLNTYKYFIETNTNLKIDKLKIIWFNVDNDDYKLFELSDKQSQIKLMFDRFKSDSLFAKI